MPLQHDPVRQATHTAPARLSSWVSDHAFIGAAWFTILVTLVALIREMLPATTNVARFEALAVLLLVAALCAQLGPSQIYRIKKIGPVELFERASSLLLALSQVGLELPVDAGELPKQELTPSLRHAYREADFYLLLVEQTGQEFVEQRDQLRYWWLLMQVGYVALARGETAQAIARLKRLQRASQGRYESAKVAYILGIAYMRGAPHEREKRQEFLRNAATCLRSALKDEPDNHLAAFRLAYALDDLEDYGSAAASNRRALAIRPQFAPARYNLAISLSKAGQTDGALKALEGIAATDEDFEKVIKNAKTDNDLDSLRSNARFVALAARWGL